MKKLFVLLFLGLGFMVLAQERAQAQYWCYLPQDGGGGGCTCSLQRSSGYCYCRAARTYCISGGICPETCNGTLAPESLNHIRKTKPHLYQAMRDSLRDDPAPVAKVYVGCKKQELVWKQLAAQEGKPIEFILPETKVSLLDPKEELRP
jgi:hypothetical protein